MKHILFVDDEPKVLEGLRRMLYSCSQDWDIVFATSGEEALVRLAESRFDVLVTDVRMPRMGGVELLGLVRDRYPHVVRIVLSGQADKEMTLSSVALAHQYLAKPCDAASLRATVDRAVNLHDLLGDPALREVVSRIHSLPSIPTVYTELMEAVQLPDVSPRALGEIIAQDLSMTTKLLQLANSSVFGIQRRITNPTDAVIYLGTEIVRALALTVSLFSQFDTARAPNFSLESLRDRGLAVGAFARQVARSLHLSKTEAEDAFMGGLLHELGKVVLACNYPEEYEAAILRAEGESIPLRDAELEIFGATHAQVGAYLLWLWGLPAEVTDIVARYDRLGPDAPGSLLAVYVANALVSGASEQRIDIDALSSASLFDRLTEWRQMAEEMKQGVGA